jgi:CelD/BcsL family acetyltransferase involved in cellulose biosynthesis
MLPRVRVLRLLGGSVVGSDFLDVIAAIGHEATVVRQLSAYLQKAEGWDLAELTSLDENSLLLRHLRDNAPDFCSQPIEEARQICPFIEFDSEPPEHWIHLKNKAKRKIRGLEPLGPLAVERVEHPEAVAEAFPAFVALHQQRRVEKGEQGIFASAANRRFHDQICQAASEAGWLQLCFLTVGGSRVAAVYQFRYADRIYYYQTGYDLAWSRHSVGFVLFTLLIDQARCEGCLTYEFLRGDEPYKYTLGATGERQLVGVRMHQGSLKARLYLSQHSLLRIVRRGILQWLPGGMKTRLKAFLAKPGKVLNNG